MRIKLKTIMAGPDGSTDPGHEIEVDAKTAKELVAGGFAEEVEHIETASIQPEEKAQIPKPKARTPKRGAKK